MGLCVPKATNTGIHVGILHIIQQITTISYIHRSRIVSTIRDTVDSFGRNVNVIETVIDP